MKPELSIIIVSYNSSQFLAPCLHSLSVENQIIVDQYNWEIIVVDNHSSDDSVEKIKQNFSDVKIIENSINLGFGKANNIGVNQAQGQYLLLINPDTIADRDLIQKTFRFFEEYSDKNAFGGMLINADGTEQRGARRSFPTLINACLHFTKLAQIFPYKRAYNLSHLPIEPHLVECVSGACIGIPKPVYEAIQGFDEQFFLHFEDIDLCQKLWRAGYQLWFYPSVKLFHIKGGSSQLFPEIKLQVNQWFLESLEIYLWKWNKRDAILFTPILMLLKLFVFLKTLAITGKKTS